VLGGQVSFSGGTGTITVNATQATGVPQTCMWQVTGPDTDVSVGSSGNCQSGPTATLNVLQSAVGKQYSVVLTQQNVSQPPVIRSQLFTVTSAPNGVDFTFPSASIGFSVTSVGGTVTPSITGITLTGIASGTPPLNYSWSLPLGAGTAGCSIPSPGPSTSNTVTLAITKAGTCDVTLTVSNGIPPNATATHTVTIGSTVGFSTIKTILGNPIGAGAQCTGCHNDASSNPPPSKSWQATPDDSALRARLANEIDPAPQSSLLLVCPSTGTCAPSNGMPQQTGFFGGNLSDYNAVLTWIINGTP
jgi:hypothetical protein